MVSKSMHANEGSERKCERIFANLRVRDGSGLSKSSMGVG